ncbi:MAG: fibronectin type III domain-containing protein [Candidatus Gracilibacteria bacterium]
MLTNLFYNLVNMKSIFRFLGFVSLLFVLIVESFALDAPSDVEIESFTDTSVVVKWEPLEDAIMYYVYYSKVSGVDADYENYSDFVEGDSVEITELEEGQNYYFAVTSLDENGEESVYSEEIVFDVNNIDQAKRSDLDFALDGVSVISYNKIELSFTNPLDNSKDTMREFKVVNKSDNFDTFEVILTELNPKNDLLLGVTLDRNLKVGNQYEVIIVAIVSATGRNIESGIDNIETFTVRKINETVELNSASPEEETSLIGTNLSAEEVENTTLALANNQTALPTTGPEHVLMLILSIILGAVIFIFNYKKA